MTIDEIAGPSDRARPGPAPRVLPDADLGIEVADAPEGLSEIHRPDCAAVIWRRQPLSSLQNWLDRLDPVHLPRARLIVRPQAVRSTMTTLCEEAGTPKSAERERLVDDIAGLADIFAGLMRAPSVQVRLDVVRTNACRKFHVDALTARLICTYRGSGTQYGIATSGAEPGRVFTVPTGSPILMRGMEWPETPRSGFLHRSPPIEGTGETRLVLVLDPVYDLPGEA